MRHTLPDRGSHVDRGPVCQHCDAEIRFLKLGPHKHLPVDREPSDSTGYVTTIEGIAHVLDATTASQLRDEGYQLFAIHDCPGSRDRRRRQRPGPAAEVVRLPARPDRDQLALDGPAIEPGKVTGIEEQRIRRARRRMLGGTS